MPTCLTPYGAEPAVGVAGRDRRDADERAATAAHHLARRVLEHVHGAVDVEVDGVSPQLRVGLGDRPDGLRAARAMHHAVQPAVPCRRGVDRTATSSSLVMSAGSYRIDRIAGKGFDLLDRRREAVGVAADDHDGGAAATSPAATPLPIPLPPPVIEICPVFERKLHARPSQTGTGSSYRTMSPRGEYRSPGLVRAWPRGARGCRGGPAWSAWRCASPRRRAAGRSDTCSRCGPPSARDPARECGMRAAAPR